MNRNAYAIRGYEERRRRREGPEPELPTEMTPEGIAMETELEHRRVTARKDALRRSRLKRHKLFAVKLQGGEVRS